MKSTYRIIRIILTAVLMSSIQCTDRPRYQVIDSIRDAAKLATTETILDKIVLGTKDKKVLGIIKLNQARFAAYSTAIVTTGIDVTKLRPDDIAINGTRIELKLPAVSLINFSYPFSGFHIDEFITEGKFLNRIDIFDQERFYQLAETEIRRNLKFSGVATSTETRTRQLLTGILKQAGYEEVYISFCSGDLNHPDKLGDLGDTVGDLSYPKPSKP